MSFFKISTPFSYTEPPDKNGTFSQVKLYIYMQFHQGGTFREKANDFLEKVCPVLGTQSRKLSKDDIWGEYLSVHATWSMDNDIRTKASSGGTLTALAIYLLEKRMVDGVIQVKASPMDPTKTIGCVSTSKDQVIDACGSRYAISSPWIGINELEDDGKSYVAIGKPCDIYALRNMKDNLGRYKNIKYLLSFFCAGLPSDTANRMLIEKMGCNYNDLKTLSYRGNGWPGLATVVDKDGRKYEMSYNESWGGVLVRDVNPFCRICIDGIGESADIACGDGWYIKDGKPDFGEHVGRNVTFIRTAKGKELFEGAIANHDICSVKWDAISDLKIIQKYQYLRRSTMQAKLIAFKLFLRQAPLYDRTVVRSYSTYSDLREKLDVFWGTIKRIIKRKI